MISRILMGLVLVTTPAFALPSPPSTVVAVGTVGMVTWSCPDIVATFTATSERVGSVALQGPYCHHSQVFSGECSNEALCDGLCQIEPTGAAVCWWGTPEPDPVRSGSYVRLDNDGSFLWLLYGITEAYGTLVRLT